ncbi:hypothetical protein [Mesobacillus jeotgali]|nr:hypothetical protein [Mesobacillus jeotgali]
MAYGFVRAFFAHTLFAPSGKEGFCFYKREGNKNEQTNSRY